jgi:hypothetical protein
LESPFPPGVSVPAELLGAPALDGPVLDDPVLTDAPLPVDPPWLAKVPTLLPAPFGSDTLELSFP